MMFFTEVTEHPLRYFIIISSPRIKAYDLVASKPLAAMLFSYVALSFLSTTLFAHASPLFDAQRSVNSLDCLQPNLTDKAPWTSVADINQYLSVGAKTRVSYFWSGGVGGLPAKGVAEQCAGKVGANDLTLGMAMCNTKKFTMPSDYAYGQYPEARKAWEDASEIFASKANNIVYTLTGSSSVTSVWLRVEFPELRDNSDVKAIIQLNKDCGPVCHWQCLNNNPACSVCFFFSFLITNN